MHLVESLLAAIIREDGESLVLHVGERPVVVSVRGPREVTQAPMTLEGMVALLSELLPADAEHALAEYGAVESELQPSTSAPGERFTVVAARGGDDVWIELRRKRGTPGKSESEGRRRTPHRPAPRSARKAASEVLQPSKRPEPSPRSCCLFPNRRTERNRRRGRCRRAREASNACSARRRRAAPKRCTSSRMRARRFASTARSSRSTARARWDPQDVEALVLEVLPERLEARSADHRARVDLRHQGRRPRPMPGVQRSSRRPAASSG